LALSDNLTSKFVRKDVEDYLYKLLPKRDAVLREMEAYAQRHNVPIIGPAVARLLALFVQTSGARRIFEMGSAIGYSTIWLARAAGPSGRVFYTDGSPENACRAAGYFLRAGVRKRIEILIGDALDSLRQAPGKFDLIFLDVDKQQYPAAFRLAVPRLRRRGLLVADNTLRDGLVTHGTHDLRTRGVQRFNRLAYSSKQLFPVLVPLRDGVTICRKL
jgi:predicted O-methyltransferase YrrM